MLQYVLLLLAAVGVAMGDECAPYMDCQSCVMHSLCGWCSVPVVYADGSEGPQCAGFSPNGSTPFVCKAIYSTAICQRGYMCNPVSGQCMQTDPGKGIPIAQCQAYCRKVTDDPTAPTGPTDHPTSDEVYGCDVPTRTCHKVPPGTPGSASKEVCELQCNPSAPQDVYECDRATLTCRKTTPGHGTSLIICQQMCTNTTNSIPPVTDTYDCNHTTLQCYKTTPGHGASLEVCRMQCNNVTVTPPPPADVFDCDRNTGECYKTTPGHGTSLEVCKLQCKKETGHPTPSPTQKYTCDPEQWKCIPASEGVSYPTCMQVCNGTTPAPTIPPTPGPPPMYLGIWRGIEIQHGYPILEYDIYINNSWVVFKRVSQSHTISFAGVPFHIPDSPDLEMWVEIKTGEGAGKTLRTIGEIGAARGPQTSFGTMALGVPGGDTPASIKEAMTDGTSIVLALAHCIPGNVYCVFTMPETLKRILEPNLVVSANAKRIAARTNDRCAQWAQACSVCISHEYCGWCSVPVQYVDGTQGTQCAGFQGNETRFVCPGRYSTLACEVGYQCNAQLKCIPTVPGDGMPLSTCAQICRPTPSPPPVPKLYKCDLVTHQCSPCTEMPCPGSMPLEQCAQLCPNPHPGPTPAIVGVWRGIYIQQGYSAGEVDVVMDPSGATFYKDGAQYFHAAVTSLGADVMLFKVDSGAYKGHTLGALYQLAPQGMYEQMTMAFSKPDGNFPSEYNTPMFTPGMTEMVLAKCLQAPCEFVKV